MEQHQNRRIEHQSLLVQEYRFPLLQLQKQMALYKVMLHLPYKCKLNLNLSKFHLMLAYRLVLQITLHPLVQFLDKLLKFLLFQHLAVLLPLQLYQLLQFLYKVKPLLLCKCKVNPDICPSSTCCWCAV